MAVGTVLPPPEYCQMVFPSWLITLISCRLATVKVVNPGAVMGIRSASATLREKVVAVLLFSVPARYAAVGPVQVNLAGRGPGRA